VAHACNPSYSGGRDFEASLDKWLVKPYLEKPFTEMGLVEWLKVKALV
jgi:hypothetical protein